MIKHYHNKAARRARKRLCDKSGDCPTIRELAEEFWGEPENVVSFFAEAAALDEKLARKRRGSDEND